MHVREVASRRRNPARPFSSRLPEAYTLLQGGASHFDDEWMLYANYTPIYRENGVRVHVPKGFYSTEFYTSKLIEYLDGRTADGTFFAYLSVYRTSRPFARPG